MSESTIRLSKKGRRLLKGCDGINPIDHLGLEILARFDDMITLDNLIELADACIEACGSAEAAVLALKQGKIEFEKVGEEDW